MKKRVTLATITIITSLSCGLALSAEQEQDRLQDRDQTQDEYKVKDGDLTRDRDQLQIRDQDKIYGSQLMTAEERARHRAALKSAKTQQEREQIRMKHHEHMKIRAKNRGITLPDEASSYGRGMMRQDGKGKGPGSGKGR